MWMEFRMLLRLDVMDLFYFVWSISKGEKPTEIINFKNKQAKPIKEPDTSTPLPSPTTSPLPPKRDHIGFHLDIYTLISFQLGVMIDTFRECDLHARSQMCEEAKSVLIFSLLSQLIFGCSIAHCCNRMVHRTSHQIHFAEWLLKGENLAWVMMASIQMFRKWFLSGLAWW